MGPSNINESLLIRPWSVIGKYVRRCVILYERMQFDKLVELCKRARVQFKHLSEFIDQIGGNKQADKSCGEPSGGGVGGGSGGGVGGNVSVVGSSSQQANTNVTNPNGAGGGTSRGAASNSLFLHDESNLTITSEWFNRFKSLIFVVYFPMVF